MANVGSNPESDALPLGHRPPPPQKKTTTKNPKTNSSPIHLHKKYTPSIFYAYLHSCLEDSNEYCRPTIPLLP